MNNILKKMQIKEWPKSDSKRKWVIGLEVYGVFGWDKNMEDGK